MNHNEQNHYFSSGKLILHLVSKRSEFFHGQERERGGEVGKEDDIPAAFFLIFCGVWRVETRVADLPLRQGLETNHTSF